MSLVDVLRVISYITLAGAGVFSALALYELFWRKT